MNKRLVTLSLILVAVAAIIGFVPLQREVPLKKPFSAFPLQVQGWVGKDFGFDEVILDKLKVSEYLSREYVKPPHRVGMYVGYYTSQREGAQIHSPKHCLPGGGWLIVSEQRRSAELTGFGKVDYVESVYQKGGEKEVIVYWYQMKDSTVTGDYGLKLRMILNSLRYQRNDGAFIRLSAPVQGTDQETVATLRNFMQEVMPLLKEHLPD